MTFDIFFILLALFTTRSSEATLKTLAPLVIFRPNSVKKKTHLMDYAKQRRETKQKENQSNTHCLALTVISAVSHPLVRSGHEAAHPPASRVPLWTNDQGGRWEGVNACQGCDAWHNKMTIRVRPRASYQLGRNVEGWGGSGGGRREHGWMNERYERMWRIRRRRQRPE